jgi:hypothetical protein
MQEVFKLMKEEVITMITESNKLKVKKRIKKDPEMLAKALKENLLRRKILQTKEKEVL